jgi:hypothetical protein
MALSNWENMFQKESYESWRQLDQKPGGPSDEELQVWYETNLTFFHNEMRKAAIPVLIERYRQAKTKQTEQRQAMEREIESKVQESIKRVQMEKAIREVDKPDEQEVEEPQTPLKLKRKESVCISNE